MTLWFTSDHHFGHANIIGYAGRPFVDVDHMSDYLVGLWNDEIEPGDEVWVLGDFALGKIDESLQVAGRLNGDKYLLPGNHDRCWRGHKKSGEWRRRYLDAGFEAILDEPQSMTIAGHEVAVDHFPYKGTGDHPDMAKERYREWKLVDGGGWLLHGHVHERWRIRGRQINVGVDAWAGHPVSVEQVEHYLTEPHPHDRKPYRWPRSAGLVGEDLEAYLQKIEESARRHSLTTWGIAAIEPPSSE